ncbi:hypothetical protein [Mesorhizobium ciceri]|nr:hypothetical protein [Mesorhizobium ciceri]
MLENGSPSVFIERLSEFEWEYNGDPYVLSRSDVSNILIRYLDGKLRAEELEEWADAIELREDIRYEDESESWISDVIFTLASSALNGPITQDLVEGFLKSLDKGLN